MMFFKKRIFIAINLSCMMHLLIVYSRLYSEINIIKDYYFKLVENRSSDLNRFFDVIINKNLYDVPECY
jgi:hypothetical protein